MRRLLHFLSTCVLIAVLGVFVTVGLGMTVLGWIKGDPAVMVATGIAAVIALAMYVNAMTEPKDGE